MLLGTGGGQSKSSFTINTVAGVHSVNDFTSARIATRASHLPSSPPFTVRWTPPHPTVINCSCLQRQNRAGHSIRLVRDATLKPVTHSRLNNVAICHTDKSASLTAYVFATLSHLPFFLSSVRSLFYCSIHSIHSSYSFDLIFTFNCFHTFAFSQLLPLILFLFLHWMLSLFTHVVYYLILFFLSLLFVFHLLLLFLRVLLINFLWF